MMELSEVVFKPAIEPSATRGVSWLSKYLVVPGSYQ